MTLTPYELVLLLEIFIGQLAHKKTNEATYNTAIRDLRTAELIMSEMPTEATRPPPPVNMTYHGHMVTEKARVFIERILATPQPVQTWGYPS